MIRTSQDRCFRKPGLSGWRLGRHTQGENETVPEGQTKTEMPEKIIPLL
jgi:hypothetical protein